MTEQDMHLPHRLDGAASAWSVGFADDPRKGREDDRNDELDDSPVPDPEETDGDAEDVPEAD